MARRRLNKKVALLGTTLLLLLVLAAVFVLLRLNRDATPFIADGDAAWAVGDYLAARENYERAYSLADSSEMRIDLLFKRADVYRELGEWDRVLGCWEAIVTMDPQNPRAHLGRLKYVYILADSLGTAGRSMSVYWDEVLAQARTTMDAVRTAGLLNHRRTDLEPSFGLVKEHGWARGAPVLGPHLHFVKGRAALELAAMGAVTSPDELLREAEADLQEARRLDPNNEQVYQYLAQVFIERGRLAASRGHRVEQTAAERQADQILAEALETAGDVPEAHINVLMRRLSIMERDTISAARKRMKALAPEYDQLTRRFASSPRAFAAKAQFHSFFSSHLDSVSAMDMLDRAIQAAEQAVSLDPDNTEYAILAAGYQYRKFSIYGDTSALRKAIAVVEEALTLPDAQDAPGPTQTARRINRFSLSSLLARCCVEGILALPESDPARQGLLARAEKAVHEIGQIHGSGENPEVLKWRGMLDLASGRTGQAVRALYVAYEQNRAANPPEQRDPFLAHMLATIFKNTAETGAVIDFLGTALNAGIIHTRPEVLLDYGDALRQAGSHEVVLNAVDSFEERFGENNRSRALRVRALVGGGYIAEAEEAAARLDPDDPETLEAHLDLIRAQTTQLLGAIHRDQVATGPVPAVGPAPEDRPEATGAMRAELLGYHRREADLTQRLLRADPDAIEEPHVMRLSESLIEQGDFATAKKLVEAFLTQSPNSVGALFYRGLLAEPDPQNCPEPRRREIREQAIGGIPDPIRRSLELGLFYQQAGQAAQAAAQWRSVLEATASRELPDAPTYLDIHSISPRHLAAGHLFDLARQQENWTLAEEIVDLVRRENLDDSQGALFAARLAFARQQYDRALTQIDECLKQRPVFSYGYMLRGNVRAALGRDHEAIEDIRQASRLNPMDPVIARTLANVLYVRNSRLGVNASAEQQVEARQALERAIQLSPRDPSLLSAYADLIEESDLMKAMAIRQTIQVHAPSLANAVMLGRIATQAALDETDGQKKEAFFEIAETAFEQARQIDPTDPVLLDSYAAYFRARGRHEEAAQLLIDSDDDRLLWRHYFRVRNFREAGRILAKMYDEDDNKIDALRGLLLIAEETADRQGVRKYSEELLLLEDNAVNRMAQLRAYLNVGLITEAERRLQSFKERHPAEPRLLLMEAQVAQRQGQLKRALDLVNRALENDQQNAGAWRLRGEISLLMGDAEQAIFALRRSRTLENDPVTTVSLARAYVQAGRDNEAIADLRRVMELSEPPLEAMTLLEAIYQRLGRNDALRQLYADVLAAFPNSIFWLNRAGGFAIDQGQYEQAEGFFRKAFQLQQQASVGAPSEPQYSAALDGYFRAIILSAGEPGAPGGDWRPQRLDRVIQEGGQYAETPYAPVALLRMAEARKLQDDLPAARNYARRAIDQAWANEPLAVEMMLRVTMLLGEDEVSAYGRQRLAAEPDSLAANFVMFSLAKLQDRYDEAVGYIDACIRLAGADVDAVIEYTVRKADLLTTAYRNTSDKTYLEKAIASYESLRAKMPKNSSVLNNLAFMLAQNDQRLAEALVFARTAVEQNPNTASYLDTYAYVLHKNGRHAEAAERLAAAIQQYETEGTVPAEVYEHLGMVNEALGQQSQALTAYRRALEVGGDALPDSIRQRLDAAVRRLAP